MPRRIKDESELNTPRTVADQHITTLSHSPRGSRAAKQAKDAVSKDIESKVQMSGDTVWVHNVSNTEYHVRPVSNKTVDAETAIEFQLNEIRPFHPEQINEMRFKTALLKGHLKIVQEHEIEGIEREIEKAAKKEENQGKVTKGVNTSGLPNNKKAALAYIYDCEDIDELEGYAQEEDREFIITAIDDRIEELEEAGKGFDE